MAARTIGILVPDGVQALDVAGPADVFCEANAFVPAGERYETVLVAATRALRASNGMRLVADRTLAEARDGFSVLLAAGGPSLPESPPDPGLGAWLAGAAARSGLYGSVCTGAFVLGHAGLLDDHAATTHWQNAARLAALFPRARVDPDRIFLRDRRLITSAGVTAGIDLALALVRQDHGEAAARAVAKRLVVVAQRQGGQSQFSPFLAAPADEASPLARVQAHVLHHIGERFTLARLAAIAGTSPRHLARLFIREAGMTPHAFVEGARVDVARNLLEGSALPFKAVAYDCGFGTAERMRLVFVRRLGVSPAQYRAGFRGPEARPRRPVSSASPRPG
ncbi:HTH-type transcriptional activator RhaR [Methylobacterium crusticola]|uniref:HTH-type transcriptional activator RhaR n=1 Tax=Methylobacterium crusticola TaxID=1697972 RepID=A0ABQ4R8N2_9HYPH|nr:helix-turn-helix domain-containing protein [Methylobacterium crusticola]GJD53469.1 HTH-type transcriptional activator RhaR [Methylobacterium crusticola]